MILVVPGIDVSSDRPQKHGDFNVAIISRDVQGGTLPDSKRNQGQISTTHAEGGVLHAVSQVDVGRSGQEQIAHVDLISAGAAM